jgi:predicted DNA-binding transcriptional regulator AlpA
MHVERKPGHRSRAGQRRHLPHTLMPPDNQAATSGAPLAHSNEDALLTDFDLERLTGKARSSWQKARLTGDGPKFIRLGRLVRYWASDVEAWLAARPSLRSTSEAA